MRVPRGVPQGAPSEVSQRVPNGVPQETPKVSRRSFVSLASASALTALVACAGCTRWTAPRPTDPKKPTDTRDLNKYKDLAIAMDAWNYDQVNDVWWQNALTYCLTPATKMYGRLAIYVPGPFFTGKAHGKTYSCTINEKAQVGNFTPKTAPVVMPLNPIFFTGQNAPTAYSYEGLKPYLSAGFIYVYAGFRGRNNGYDSERNTSFAGGIPWGAVDIKAAIRYLRYNAEALPGDLEKIIPFGVGSSGALACILGATGNAPEYEPYLSDIGAAAYDAQGHNLSDSIYAVRAWSPSLACEGGNAAFEWYCGQYANDKTRDAKLWTSSLSYDLSRAYAEHLNSLKLTANKEPLTLENTMGGLYVDGSYYRYLLKLLEDAASSFLSTVTFPYTPAQPTLGAGMFPGDGNLNPHEAEAIARATTKDPAEKTPPVSYATREDYIKALNADYRWITFNERTNHAKITSIGAFIAHMRPAVDDVAAYDSLSGKSYFNQLFGTLEKDALHFDGPTLSCMTTHQDAYAKKQGWDPALIKAWKDDLELKDGQKKNVIFRLHMSDPLYYLTGKYAGFGKASVAHYWNIQTGLAQANVSFTHEANLLAALQAYDGVKSAVLTPVWNEGLSMNQPGVEPVQAFIEWVSNECKQ